MPKKLRVGVIFGGRSGEHEVSIRSARAIIESIDRKKFDVVPIAITKEGKWLPPADSAQLLPAAVQPLLNSSATSTTGDIALLGDPSHKGLISLKGNSQPLVAEKLDVVFPALHGTYGEDGTLQGLLEMADVPYVGCGVLASSCGMDKVTMKSLFVQAGLPICKYVWFLRSQWRNDPAKIIRNVSRQIGFPCFVKPANLGSSVGVSRATDKASLTKAIDLAAEYDRKIIVEEEVIAREIECAVLGNDEPRASLPGEYVVYDEAARFLDYTEKYTNTGNVSFVVPAPLSKAMTTRIQKMAISAFQSVDGAGLARVDFFLSRDGGGLIINELNTMPGLTEVSGYPKMWQASGLPFAQLLETLIDLAFERHRDKSLTKTSR
ncbi:MAG TPA: D-alanine--D-alanine ligase family protein [Pyrinomonadaceae bacterium]|nr:D-alanine--D-alanine ligase family protein [Pyrinomonadaceae bacterium]